ncbi:MAG: AsnC family transcriptional regulator [Candidatus Omnitrophica bacterium]|nr:AsnC family transcriptional regulator [Candidatus Omnitrophota bacterium]MBD3269241.1 AsnC family transcriptional regulator [Candidatus Omnitrophota bacterium]
MKDIHKEILKALKVNGSTYAHPINSQLLSKILNVDPSYIRFQMAFLRKMVGVRRGKKGGYYIKKNNE